MLAIISPIQSIKRKQLRFKKRKTNNYDENNDVM